MQTGSKSSQNDRRCDAIDSVEPRVQSNAFGKYICGKQGSVTFQNVIRPDRGDDYCPRTYQKCSAFTEA
jgi:hypothetical protein